MASTLIVHEIFSRSISKYSLLSILLLEYFFFKESFSFIRIVTLNIALGAKLADLFHGWSFFSLYEASDQVMDVRVANRKTVRVFRDFARLFARREVCCSCSM